MDTTSYTMSYTTSYTILQYYLRVFILMRRPALSPPSYQAHPFLVSCSKRKPTSTRGKPRAWDMVWSRARPNFNCYSVSASRSYPMLYVNIRCRMSTYDVVR